LSKVIDLIAVLHYSETNSGPKRIENGSQMDRRTLKIKLRLGQVAIHCQIFSNVFLDSGRSGPRRGSAAVFIDMRKDMLLDKF